MYYVYAAGAEDRAPPAFGVDFRVAPRDYGGKNCVDYYFMYMYSLYTLNFVNKNKYLSETSVVVY
jgi:hypothetical protein